MQMSNTTRIPKRMQTTKCIHALHQESPSCQHFYTEFKANKGRSADWVLWPPWSWWRLNGCKLESFSLLLKTWHVPCRMSDALWPQINHQLQSNKNSCTHHYQHHSAKNLGQYISAKPEGNVSRSLTRHTVKQKVEQEKDKYACKWESWAWHVSKGDCKHVWRATHLYSPSTNAFISKQKLWRLKTQVAIAFSCLILWPRTALLRD